MAEDLRPAVRVLARVARVLERFCTEISLPQYRVLSMIEDGDERATQLAGHLALTKPTITAAVDGLVERGLVRRRMVEGDRRAVRLVITSEGRKILAAAESAMACALAGLFERTDDRAGVLRALDSLQEALDSVIAERMKAAVAAKGAQT